MKNAFLFIKRVCVFLVLALLQFLFSGNSKHQENVPEEVFEERRWTGTLTLDEKYTGITGTSERQVTVTFNNTLPTLHRDETGIIPTDPTAVDHFTDDKGTGSETYHAEGFIAGKKVSVTDASGSGQSQLNIVDINDEDYYIHAIGPVCNGTQTNLLDGTTTDAGPYTTDIVISERWVGAEPSILSGSKTETVELPGEMGNMIRTVSWHLTKSTVSDVELIVTPENYDSWLPEPGKNENMVGSVMNVSLKLQARGGGTTTRKAKAFELKLSNTSKEPGITINFPIAPWDDPMPDVRFLIQPNAGVEEEFQLMKINCPGGCQTAQAKIGSYDGGGWTTLTVEAILQDDSRVPGMLFISGGERDIRIPKRDPNSKIAKAWLTDHGNPGETDDKETSKGNGYKGDGLTAYEEYRGVISELEFVNHNPNKFGRLNPNKKELGVKIKRAELSLFAEAFQLFENAGDLKIIRFYENEISSSRRLNKNALSAHDYDQFVLRVEKRNLPPGIIGTAYRGPNIPAVTDPVVFDWDQIQSGYQILANNERPASLRFTLREKLAWAVTHELGHAVNVEHHGNDLREPDQIAEEYNRSSYRIFDRHGNLITTRPFPLKNIGGSRATVESGDIFCVTSYNIYYSWGYRVGADGAKIFNKVPLLPLGNTFCSSGVGTDINATQLYFGDAAMGNCLAQIKLRN